MAEEAGSKTKTSPPAEGKGKRGYRDSDFISLNDLVYAPLHALAKSNEQLKTHVVEAIKGMATIRQSGQEEIIHLDCINLAYDQIRPEAEEGCSVDKLQLQVPLMSIIPVTNLNVEKAEIGFSAEISVVNENEGKCNINARICSPEQRDSDFLPRVSFKMQVASIPATEGIMRLIDLLSANQVARQLDNTPVTIDGGLGSDTHKMMRQQVNERKAKVKKLKLLYQKITDMIAEQEKLQQVSRAAFDESPYEFDRDKFLMAQSNIANRIMEYQEQIMSSEINFGLENDYK
ncbi:DUF2589 domain-containing protein [Lacrimispora amygdalina]|uniref:DUF2589 domain-containing protein n=1 Tax=Lacrimispora amygdalina TaxID=253257 RepID=A0A3E2N578_9FIRM|nr:DUF2589 domain-containing protein [Clostridium indicum]RFZ76149.1 DUF2589 domain-containing protein [Clostridium indicum]